MNALNKWSYVRLSTSSDKVIQLTPSKIYLRVLGVLYALTLYLLYILDTYLVFKITLFFLVNLIWIMYLYSNQITSLGFSQNKWFVINQNGVCCSFENAELILSNEIFLLIRLSNSTSSKIYILFIDQLAKADLLNLSRLLSKE